MNVVKKLAYGFALTCAALCATGSFADTATDYVSESSGKATIIDLGEQFAVVFSNEVSTAITLTALKPCTLIRSLVVGGGGAGGSTLGGGGGGGQVQESFDLHAISANDVLTLTVGAGGAWGAGGFPAGLQGGTSCHRCAMCHDKRRLLLQ